VRERFSRQGDPDIDRLRRETIVALETLNLRIARILGIPANTLSGGTLEGVAAVGGGTTGGASLGDTVAGIAEDVAEIAAGTIQIDHGTLSGLTDDDHAQYLLVSGTRAMTGALNMGSQSITSANAGTYSGTVTAGALSTSGNVTATGTVTCAGLTCSSVTSSGAISGTTITGTGIVTGSELRTTDDVRITERASAPSTAASFGYFWVVDDAPNNAMFTDDAGLDHPLSYSDEVLLHPNDFVALSGSTVTLATSGGGYRQLEYDGTNDNYAVHSFWLPRKYAGSTITVTLAVSGSAANGSSRNIRWEVALETCSAGTDVTTTSFDTATAQDAMPTATAEQLSFVTFTLATADMDGAVAGDMMRVRVARLGSHANDNYSGTGRVHLVRVRETV
jgi:hypothetical protein